MVIEARRRLSALPPEAVYVGDMAVDVETARAAGVAVWLVPDGAANSAHPDRVLRSFNDLVSLLPGRTSP